MKRKTITFSEMKRLSLCNSRRCPQYVELVGVARRKTVRRFLWWTGIGWVEVPEHQAENPVLVVED